MQLENSTKRSVDGKTEIHVYSKVRKEIYGPTDKDNINGHDIMLKAIKAWGEGMLKTLDNGACAERARELAHPTVLGSS